MPCVVGVRKFDRDVAEAAAEAAATSRSPFDDYTYSNNNPNNGGGGGGYPYSDATHGTITQAPMLPTDTYGMSEMTQHDPYAAGAVSLATANLGRTRSRLDSESQKTPGIAGVGTGNLAREPSRRTPYHAFVGPGPQPHEMMDRALSGRYRPRGMDLLEGAGLAGTGIAAMAAAANNNNNGNRAFNNRRPSGCTHQTHGSMRSQGHSQGHSSSENYHAPLQPEYQAQAQAPPRGVDAQYADAYTGYAGAPYSQARQDRSGQDKDERCAVIDSVVVLPCAVYIHTR
ncbi:hypothetical protein EDD22DRAFT_1004288 [Suillus occidentalis]|nr:hypothetical protein EDD22DRAFT_1004288 [Suillus occidentalis]